MSPTTTAKSTSATTTRPSRSGRTQRRGRMALAQFEPADKLLAADPLALLLGMMLDQQVPMEKAFRGPYDLRERLGRDLDAARIATYEPERMVEHFVGPPALHRFPAAMAKRTQALCAMLVERYGGDPTALWSDGDGAEVLGRLRALPGFGAAKARIFLALLGKQYGVTPAGWREAAGDVGADGVQISVADVVDAGSLAAVRAAKKERKAAARAGSQG